MAYVRTNAVQGGAFDGFSFTKLTNWVAGTATAIASGNKTAIANQVTAAIPGKSTPAVKTQTTAPTSPGFFSPGGFVEKNQTVLLLAAAGLAAFLVLGRRK